MTIFITVFDSFIAKNILRTEVLSELLAGKDDLRVILLVDAVRAAEYRKLFGSERVVVEQVEVDPTSRWEKLWISFTWHTVSTHTLRIQLFGGPNTPRRGIFNRTATHIARLIFGNTLGRTLLRTFEYWVFRNEAYADLFLRYKPDVVFAANVFAPLDIELLREAKRRRIRTIGMVKSWDNVTSKGLIRQLPDRMIVHTERIVDELQKYDGMPRGRVSVVGVPQYDIYFRPDDEERISFWRRYGIDGAKKVILYLEPGMRIAEYGHEIWPMVDAYATKNNVELFMSIHPSYSVREDVLATLSKTKVVRLGYRLDKTDKSWELDENALLDLMRAMRYCDLVLTTGSTMNIESSIFDKPIINTMFDGLQKLPYHQSLKQGFDYDHLIPIKESGGVKIAYSSAEMLEQMDFLLQHPEWGREGRRHIVEEQCVYTDGNSSKRLARVVLDFIGNKST